MGYNASDILALYGVEEPGTKKETTTADKILALYGVEKPATVQRQPKQTVTPSAPQSAAALSGTGNTDIQMPKLEVNLPQIRAFGAGDTPDMTGSAKRIGNVLAAAGTGAAAGFVETAGQLTQPQGLTIGEQMRLAAQGKTTQADTQAAEREKAQRLREKIKDPLYATADRLTEQSAAYTEKAKEGLGEVGQFAVDLGVTGAQMMGDMALGLINPVLGTGAMATRVFGGSAQEARQAGATETEQQLYGLGSAATSVLVEKIANVGKAFKTAYGGSIAGGKVDDLLTKLTGKLMKNPAGQRILASAAGEAGEEALEALLQPALQAIYDKGATLNKTWFGSTEELTDYLTDVGYNALLGGALGALGGGGNVAAPATTETAQGGAETAQEAQNAPVTGNETPASSTGTERPQSGAQRPTWGAYMEDGDIFGGGRKTRAGFTSLENAMANQFERETGISIDSVESILGGLANGDYNSANWVARIAQDAKDSKMVVVAHELTHHLQTLAPQEYENFRTAVADYFTRAGGEAALTDMMNRYRSAYGAAGQNLSDSAVMDEMAADFTEVLLTDADLFGKFAQQNRTLAEWLLDALRAFIEKIRATFTGKARDAAAQEATGKTLNELEMIAEQWQGVYSAAAAAYGQNANTATQKGDGVVRYKRAGMADKNVVSIKKQIDAARNMLNQMAPVFSKPVDVNLKGMTVPQKRAWAEGEIKKTGSIIDRQGYGTILIDPSDINAALNYIKDDGTIEAFPAVPAVLRRGVEIYRDVNHKMRGYDTVTFAGPVEINGVRGNMAVVVRETGKNRYDMHRIVLPDGSAFEFVEKANAVPTTVGGITEDAYSSGEVAPTINTASDIRLPNLSDGVKRNLSQLKSTAPLRQMMAEMPQQMMIRMPRLTTVAQDEAEAAGLEAAPVEDTVQLPRLTTPAQDAEEAAIKKATEVDAAGDAAGEAAAPEAKAALDELVALTTGDGASKTKDTILPTGTKVRAADRGNVGTIVSYNEEDKTYVVNFVSPEGYTADVTLPADMVKSKEDEDMEIALAHVSAKTVPQEKSFKENAAESWSFFKRKMVDSGEAVTRIGKAIGDKYLYPYFNMARASTSAGVNMIAGEQTDVLGNRVGKSLNDIFDPILAEGDDYYTKFQMYLLDLHNVDRMSITERSEPFRKEAREAFDSYVEMHPEFAKMTKDEIEAQAKGKDEAQAEEAKEYLRLANRVNRANAMHNKAIFSWKATAEESQARAERLLRENPEFAQYRDEVRKYIDNLMQYRVDSGLITQKDADFLHNYYPDYVPVYRVEVEGEALNKESGRKKRVGKTIGTAKGGEQDIMPIHEALGKQTMQVVREGSKNRFGARLLQDYLNNAENEKLSQYILEVKSTEKDLDLDNWDSIKEKELDGNVFSVYRDGRLNEMAVNEELFEAAKALSPDRREAVKLTGFIVKANRLYKALITGYNPFFTARNIARDLQAAGLYSREFGAWAKNYPKALKEIFTNGKAWKQYRALGGDMSSMFEYETSEGEQLNWKYEKDKGKGMVANAAKNVMSKVEFANVAFEQAPRLAEFMAVMEKGDGSLDAAMDAMLAAADVTTNFGRSGTLAKYLNAYYIPFLNPSIQGFDKLVRFMSETNTGKKWGRLILYTSILGIAPRLLGELLYGDDDEWKEMRDSVRNSNYVFKLGNKWWKIPRGREIAVPYTMLNAGIDQIQGEDVRWLPTIKEALSQVTPVNPFKESILRPLVIDLPFNKTWYGGDIEGQRLQNYAPGKRYDTSTDVVSKAIGGALNVSPKKLNYLAEQWSGVVGDIVLPLLTPAAEGNFIEAQFTVDPVMNNELSSKFYNKADELKYAKSDGDTTAAVVSRYWNSISSDVSKLYGEIRNVENSDLKNREKLEQVQELQRQINAIQREALATVNQYTAAVESSLFGDDDDAADFAYRETNREVLGAKYALETYDKNVYAKAQEAAKSGVSYEAYYDYYFATKDIESDKDASGKVIPDSKRDKTLAEINAMNLTVEQKNALYFDKGYAESRLYEAPWYTIQMPRL